MTIKEKRKKRFSFILVSLLLIDSDCYDGGHGDILEGTTPHPSGGKSFTLDI